MYGSYVIYQSDLKKMNGKEKKRIPKFLIRYGTNNLNKRSYKSKGDTVRMYITMVRNRKIEWQGKKNS